MIAKANVTDTNGELECLDEYQGGCSGPVEYRAGLSATGKSFPRCDAHWEAQVAEQERINEWYAPFSDVPPSGFDPTYAGEEW